MKLCQKYYVVKTMWSSSKQEMITWAESKKEFMDVELNLTSKKE